MLLVANIKKDKIIKMSSEEQKLFGIDKLNIKRSEIPAVTHVDGTARLQTVSKDINSLFYNLITEFYKITGVPVLINTSMNVRGEPIVDTPEQAYNMIVKTDMDYIVMGDYIIKK